MSREPKYGTIIDAGIDYITVTAARGQDADELYDAGRRLFKEQVQLGNESRGWSMKGYSGFCAGGVSFGGREDGAIVRLSSDVAASDWFTVYQRSTNVSRIDLQVTVRLDHCPTLAIHKHEKALKRKWSARDDGPEYELRRDRRRGCTLTIGERPSMFYFRLYNKWAESGLDYYRNCLRYELEIKNRAAASATKSLASSGTLKPAIIAGLHHGLSVRGVSPLFDSSGRKSIYALLPRCATDADRKLAFLRRSIRPTVQFLCQADRLTEVLDCLGLAQFVEPSNLSSNPKG